eukprot:tig00000342_g24195.t1
MSRLSVCPLTRRHAHLSLPLPPHLIWPGDFGLCGKINYGLGSKRVFECRPGCGFRADRDGGAARSIFIRYGTGVDAKRLLGS